jgi:hypothetical protein
MQTPQLRELLWRVLSRFGGCFFGVLYPVAAELKGELVAEGAVLCSQAGDFGSGGVESLAE